MEGFLNNLGANVSLSSPRLDTVLETMVSAGYSYVYLDSDIFQIEDEGALVSLKERLGQYPLEVWSVHGSVFHPELGQPWQTYIEVHKDYIQRAQFMGAKYITYHFGWWEGGFGEKAFQLRELLMKHSMTTDEFRRLNIELLKEVAKIGRQHGIGVNIENLPPGAMHDYNRSVDDLLAIIAESDDDSIGICFDSGHAHLNDLDMKSSIVRAGQYLKETHLHDNLGNISSNNSINDLHQPVGVGTLNWLAVMAGLKEIGYSNPVVFEFFSGNLEQDPDVLHLNKNNWMKWLELLERLTIAGQSEPVKAW